MTARRDHHRAVVDDLRPHPPPRPRHLGEGHQDVEPGEHAGGPVEAMASGGDELPQLLEQLQLASHRLVLGAENLPLAVVELGRRVALGVLHRLLADVVGRHLRGVVPPHLEEEAEDAVEADLQRRDPGARDLLRLIGRDPRLPAAGHLEELVETGVAAGADETAVAGEDGAALPERPAAGVGDVVERVERVAELRQQPAAAVERRDHRREHGSRPADPLEIARPGSPRHHPPHESLDVADADEQAPEPFGERRIGDEGGGGVEAEIDGGRVDQRRREPLGEEAGPHRRSGPVEDPGERPRPALAGGAHQFEAAARRLVDLHPLAAPPGGERLDAVDRRRLVLVEIVDHGAGGGDAGEVGREVEAETLETCPVHRPVERRPRRLLLEPPIGPGGERGHAAGGAEHGGHRGPVLLGAEALARLETLHEIGHVLGGEDRRLERAGRDVDPRQPHRDRALVRRGRRAVFGRGAGGRFGGRPGEDRQEPIPPDRVEEALVGGDAGGHDPGHLAAEEPLGGLRIVDLLADGDAPPRRHELHQLRVELVVGEPGHRHGVGPLVAAGEGEVEEVRRLAGVLAEELVEVPHAEQDEGPGALRLRRLELLHHRTGHGADCSGGGPVAVSRGWARAL